MKLTELYAKREQLVKDADGFTDDTSLEDIQAKQAELKKVNAQIDLEEEKEDTAKATAAREIGAGTMTPAQPANGVPEDVRASQLYADGFYNVLRGAALTPEQAQVVGAIGTTGVPVPTSFQNKLIIALEEENVMRGLATIISTETDKDIPIVTSKGTADWTDEAGAYNESDDEFGKITLSAYKLTRILKVSEEIMEDNTFDLEGYLVQSFARAIALPEEAAMVAGDGVKKPTGIFVDAQVGVTAGSAIAITADELIDLYYSLKRPYRKKATWLMKDSTIKAVRKLKDSNGDYLWQKGLGGEPDTLLSRPVEAVDSADSIAASKKPILFGDIKYYQIADRSKRTFQRLGELYSANGQIGFRGYERVDGILTLAEAAKVLAMPAS